MSRGRAFPGGRPPFLSGLGGIIYKEFLHLARSPIRIRLLITTQLIYIFMIGFVDVTIHHVPTVLVDQDHSVASRELIRRVVATGDFGIQASADETSRARQAIEAGSASVALVIPQGYGRRTAARGPADVLTLVDGSDGVVAEQAVAAIDGVVGQLNQERLSQAQVAVPRVEPRSHLLFNPSGSTVLFELPALLAIILMGYLDVASFSFSGEAEAGNLDRLLMTPMSYNALILGKLVPYLIFAVLNGGAYLWAMHALFGVPIRGDVFCLLGAVLLYCLTLVTLGAFVAVASASIPSHAFRSVLFLVTITGSGFIFPLSSLPAWLRTISYLLPATHMIQIMRGLCLRGASVGELLPSFAFLFVAPFVFTLLAARSFAANFAAAG